MNTEKFTPGEWIIDGAVIDTHDSFEICTVSTDSEDRDGNIISETEWKANANLLVASKDMYEALKNIDNFFNNTTIGKEYALMPYIKEIKAALNKANE